MPRKHKKPSGKLVYQIKVTLDGTEPPIWRRLLVPSGITLDKLHEVLQVSMGWTNSHLHQFVVRESYYGVPHDELEEGTPTKDERRYTLAQIAKGKGSKVVYEYDFGDNWAHLIEVEKVFPNSKQLVPLCVDGARNCPPEDCGSTPGYENFLKAIADPKHPEHKEMLEWVGGEFDPEAFNVQEINQSLKRLKKVGNLEAFWV